MKLTYIFHSGFAIETENLTIIIDYYKDSSEDAQKGVVHSKLLKNPGQLYILSTHSHHDHFNPEILEWKEKRNDIKYIFSKDILDNKKAKPDDAVYLDKGDIYQDENLSIRAFGSTDLGVSYLIKMNGKIIFHAGDLNNWHWNSESTEQEVKEAEDFYQRELSFLSENVKHIDLVMFPVDPRLGKDYMKGAEQFIAAICTDIFVPMHFGMQYEKANAFGSLAEKYKCRFIELNKKGESFDLRKKSED